MRSTFTVTASDPDLGDTVSLNGVGFPSGSTMTPALPATGNPVSSVFNWTPGPLQFGTFVMSFTATSPGGQVICSVTLHIVAKPTVSTTLSNPGPVVTGTIVHDSATLTGNTPTAGGTIATRSTAIAACTTLVADETPGSNAVVNGVAPDSNNHTFTTAGTFYWQATYSGDTENVGPVSSICTSETIVVNTPTNTATTRRRTLRRRQARRRTPHQYRDEYADAHEYPGHDDTPRTRRRRRTRRPIPQRRPIRRRHGNARRTRRRHSDCHQHADQHGDGDEHDRPTRRPRPTATNTATVTHSTATNTATNTSTATATPTNTVVVQGR